MTTSDRSGETHKPRRLLTFSSGGWVLLIALVLTLMAAGVVLWPLYQTGFRPAIGDGQHVESYGFDLSNLSVARGLLAASGASKDSIRAIPPSLIETISPLDVELRNKNEREEGRFLVSSDRVIGVVIGGEARAYPLRVLSYHEVANDVVGGVPIAVTYSPLCDSAVVFDRRIDAGAGGAGGVGAATAAVEFGVSGLLYDSDLVLFDRRGDAKRESLWPQLSMCAVSGPAAGQTLKLVDFELTTYKQWVDAHPDTRVVEGLRTFKQQYKMEPFNTYLATDELRFPVSPMWDRAGILKKSRIIVTSADGGKTWKAEAPSVAAIGPAKAGEMRLYAFVFAWYAQHEKDTDYSGLH